MVNYACGFNQPETEKYFELIKKKNENDWTQEYEQWIKKIHDRTL